MNNTYRLRYLAIGLAVMTPIIGCILATQWLLGAVFLLVGGLWLLDRRVVWPLSTAAFAAGVAAAAVGCWLEVGIGWLLIGVIAGLAAWDLDAFNGRLATAVHIEGKPELITTHLRQLAIVAMLSLVLGSTALLVQIELNLGLALLVLLLAIWALSQLLQEFSRRSS